MKSWRDWPIETYEDMRTGKKLYYRGRWEERIWEKTVTIVGSRRATRYGQEVVRKFVPELVANGVTIISGFMYGIDVLSHQETVECGGITVAIVGGGINQIANRYNEKLYGEILGGGGIVLSEYEPEFKPTVWTFPQRDKLMAALATIGVVVVEGGMNSGSLITAKYAQKYGKRLMAVPGPIGSAVSMGTNWLIKSGAAKMVTEVADILPEAICQGEQQRLFKDYSQLSKLEKEIVVILENEAVTIDELCRRTSTPAGEMGKTVSILAMRDLVEEIEGKIYLS